LRLRRALALVPVLALVVLAAACRPGTNPPEAFDHGDGHAAIEQAFGPFGTGVVAQAHRVADCESGHWPYSGLNKPGHHYRGLFQLGPHFEFRINQAAAILGRWPTWWDPYINALAARLIWEEVGWRPWTCRP